MKERPILFTDVMVRATLQGIKSQTRRLNGLKEINKAPDEWKLTGTSIDYKRECVVAHFFWEKDGRVKLQDIRCPFGMPGTPLWGRETWQFDPDACDGWNPGSEPCKGWIKYAADGESIECAAPDIATIDRMTIGHTHNWDWDFMPRSFRPSIHMPRWAARLLLENTEVRIERLQDINEADALAEGVTLHPVKPSRAEKMARDAYRMLWESINGSSSWDANPWVWAIEFRRVQP